jgi:hypothetical protein
MCLEGTRPAGPVFIWLASAVEVTLLLLMARHAWSWPRRAD